MQAKRPQPTVAHLAVEMVLYCRIDAFLIEIQHLCRHGMQMQELTAKSG